MQANVYLGYGPPTNPNINTYTFTFPPATLPVPGYSIRPTLGTGSFAGDWFSIINATSTGHDNAGYLSTFIDFANDTIISMVPNATAGYGDYPMLAGPNVPSSAFVAHPNYAAASTLMSQTQRLALDLMYPSGQVFQNTTGAFPNTFPPNPPLEQQRDARQPRQ